VARRRDVDSHKREGCARAVISSRKRGGSEGVT